MTTKHAGRCDWLATCGERYNKSRRARSAVDDCLVPRAIIVPRNCIEQSGLPSMSAELRSVDEARTVSSGSHGRRSMSTVASSRQLGVREQVVNVPLYRR